MSIPQNRILFSFNASRPRFCETLSFQSFSTGALKKSSLFTAIRAPFLPLRLRFFRGFHNPLQLPFPFVPISFLFVELRFRPPDMLNPTQLLPSFPPKTSNEFCPVALPFIFLFIYNFGGIPCETCSKPLSRPFEVLPPKAVLSIEPNIPRRLPVCGTFR